jgi:hypothetical protein
MRAAGRLGALLLFAAALAGSPRLARCDGPGAPGTAAAGDLVWHTGNFFGECAGDCALSLLFGRQALTLMPWHWRWGGSDLVGAAVSRRLLTLWGALDVEPEIGAAKRIGDMHSDEGWVALYFRWTQFPWNRWVQTTVALNTGISYVADLPPGSHGAEFLHYVGPEVTFALPGYSQYQLLVQLHHRSGVWIGNSVDPGWQYLAIGLRYRF